MSCVAAIFAAAGSFIRAAAVPRRDPLTVDLAVAFAGDRLGVDTFFFLLAAMCAFQFP
jgi:hypothetical protein